MADASVLRAPGGSTIVFEGSAPSPAVVSNTLITTTVEAITLARRVARRHCLEVRCDAAPGPPRLGSTMRDASR